MPLVHSISEEVSGSCVKKLVLRQSNSVALDAPKRLMLSAENTNNTPKGTGWRFTLPLFRSLHPYTSQHGGRTTSPGSSLLVHGLRRNAPKQRRGWPLEAPPPTEQCAGGGTSPWRNRRFRCWCWQQKRQNPRQERAGAYRLDAGKCI